MNQALSVSELVYEIKVLLEDDFKNVFCTGEISNLSSSAAGHYYFNLSDEEASISCALFKMDAMRNPIIRSLKNGDKIIISGPISLYAKRGTFQVLVRKIVKSGKGTLLERYNTLKSKLAQEGLFSLDKKRKIPSFSKKCVLITANESAAMADFINVFKRRAVMGEVIIIPALVQGEKSESSLVTALKKAMTLKEIDVIIFTRGGGSMEDLWSFNSEKLARMIYDCKIPIVSAIGHQVDYTLCDYVSDLRVETPTAAAEKVTEKQVEIANRLTQSKKSLKLSIDKSLSYYRENLYKLSPIKNINRISKSLRDRELILNTIKERIKSRKIFRIEEKSHHLEMNLQSLQSSLELKLKSRENRLENIHNQLRSLNPKGVLKRGYSIIRQNNTPITSKSKFKEDYDLNIEFYDGTIEIKRG